MALSRKKKLLVFAAIMTVLLGIVGVYAFVRSGPLPPFEDIEDIKAEFGDSVFKKEFKFTVPREHWQSVYDGLLPSRIDFFTGGGVIFGELQITMKDRTLFVVVLFDLDDERQVNFKAGPFEGKRWHYRGGNTEQLKKALRAAYEAAKQKSP